MRDALRTALVEAQTAPSTELPRLLGDLEEIRATALARLTAQESVQTSDELIDVPEAARRLGVSEDYLYHQHKRLPFARKMGRKLLFSSKGVDNYIRTR